MAIAEKRQLGHWSGLRITFGMRPAHIDQPERTGVFQPDMEDEDDLEGEWGLVAVDSPAAANPHSR